MTFSIVLCSFREGRPWNKVCALAENRFDFVCRIASYGWREKKKLISYGNIWVRTVRAVGHEKPFRLAERPGSFCQSTVLIIIWPQQGKQRAKARQTRVKIAYRPIPNRLFANLSSFDPKLSTRFIAGAFTWCMKYEESYSGQKPVTASLGIPSWQGLLEAIINSIGWKLPKNLLTFSMPPPVARTCPMVYCFSANCRFVTEW